MARPLRVLAIVAVTVGLLATSARAEPTLTAIASLDEVPVGIAVSRSGRTFVSFSRAVDPKVTISVAELVNGKPVAYPKALKQDDGPPARDRLLSVQALTIDARDRLWMLDSGKVGTNNIEPGTAKLIAWDLSINREVKRIVFPAQVAGGTAFLNDVRIDLSRGTAGTAFLTDASPAGPTGLVVVDLDTGMSYRTLNDHPATKAAPGLALTMAGQRLVEKKGPAMGAPLRVGADGIALDDDYVYWSPLSSHRLYRARTDALIAFAHKTALSVEVENLGDKGFAADGLLGDAQGRIYVTDLEGSAIHRREQDGTFTLVVRDARLAWPDSMALNRDGGLYVTTTQIDRSPWLQGRDRRTKPFVVYRLTTDSTPLLLGAR